MGDEAWPRKGGCGGERAALYGQRFMEGAGFEGVGETSGSVGEGGTGDYPPGPCRAWWSPGRAVPVAPRCAWVSPGRAAPRAVPHQDSPGRAVPCRLVPRRAVPGVPGRAVPRWAAPCRARSAVRS